MIMNNTNNIDNLELNIPNCMNVTFCSYRKKTNFYLKLIYQTNARKKLKTYFFRLLYNTYFICTITFMNSF